MFRITDYFVQGDTWKVYDFGAEILTTSLVGFSSGFGDNAAADDGWTSALFSSGEVLLAVGNHSITVQGDGMGGLPARFFVRLDSVPVPEPSLVSLFAAGLIALGFMNKRERWRS